MTDFNHIEGMVAELLKTKGWVSQHIDEICGDFVYQGKSLRYWALDFFEQVHSIIRAAGETRTLVLIVPMPPSIIINIALPEYDQARFFEASVPTIYLIEEKNVFIDAFEEYRIVLDGLNPEFGSCVFRSWRDRRSNENGWEYSNDVYLWRLCS
jgi:hypothetical protein